MKLTQSISNVQEKNFNDKGSDVFKKNTTSDSY